MTRPSLAGESTDSKRLSGRGRGHTRRPQVLDLSPSCPHSKEDPRDFLHRYTYDISPLGSFDRVGLPTDTPLGSTPHLLSPRPSPSATLRLCPPGPPTN